MIDWTNAPNWAQYHAYDAGGTGGWYQNKPTLGEHGFWIASGYKWPSGHLSKITGRVWYATLEERPKEKVSA